MIRATAMANDKIDLLELHLARADKESSRALEQRFYRDPSQSVEFPVERERLLKLKKKKRKK